MAAENVKEVIKKIARVSIGGRYLCLAEIKLGGEYKTEGMELSKKQIEECGLPDAIVDFGLVLTSGLAAKNVESPELQFNITKPGEPGCVVKLQAYESVTTANNKEYANTSTKVKEALVFIALVGR